MEKYLENALKIKTKKHHIKIETQSTSCFEMEIKGLVQKQNQVVQVETKFIVDSTRLETSLVLNEQDDIIKSILETPDKSYDQEKLQKILEIQMLFNRIKGINEKINEFLSFLYCIISVYLLDDQIIEIAKENPILTTLGLLIVELALFNASVKIANTLGEAIVINKFNEEYSKKPNK